MDHTTDLRADAVGVEESAPSTAELVDLLMSILSDDLDHPEVWSQFGALIALAPDLPEQLAAREAWVHDEYEKAQLLVLVVMCVATRGQIELALGAIEPLIARYSQSAQIQGAAFYVNGLADPDNPRYHLAGRICAAPFVQLDVLEDSSHQCCASWLHASAGNLATTPWEQVWNSPTAQAVRGSILDGSYRYCNKGACPAILGDDLETAEVLADRSEFWRDILANARTELDRGPTTVNLAYDRTCNLSCHSCRTERYAADEATRARYDDMQQHRILPMLRNARTVYITGSGDPFASKNFRKLMTQLTAQDYPDLRFQIMTNGMLLTPQQWHSFPALHGRTSVLKISIDAATGPTHELLRRGAKWPVVLANMKFAGELTAVGQVAHLELVFTVQVDNYREMGDAVDLAKAVGATGVYFARLTNWGTFSHAAYERKAIFLPGHPDHADFVERMQDPRLADPMVLPGDLAAFMRERPAKRRVFKG